MGCCCCKPIGYKSVANRSATQSDKTNGEWVVTLFDTSESSGNEEEEEEEIPTLALYSDIEDSVDDQEYYREYRPDVHLLLPEGSTFKLPKLTPSIEAVREQLRMARLSAEKHYDCMCKAEYIEIISAYHNALLACPSTSRAKHSLIREYEHFKGIYGSLCIDERASLYAHERWQEAHNNKQSIARRSTAYKLAIMATDDAKLRRVWKKEYNSFFKRHR